MSEEQEHSLLTRFKRRMKIFHDSEDKELSIILNDSEEDVLRLIGENGKDDRRTKELIIERSRYVYNDSLEFFYDNFQQRILDISLDYMEDDSYGNPSKL